MEQPNLETSRLCLRPFTLTDASAVQRLAGSYEVADTALNIPHPYKDGMAEEWIGSHASQFAAGTLVIYAISLKGQDGIVGAVSLQVVKRHNRAELAYWMGRAYWGRGFTTEAAKALVQYGFEILKLHKINASHFKRNPASGRVMQKLGMTHEGSLRDHFRKGDTYEDVEVYGLLADG